FPFSSERKMSMIEAIKGEEKFIFIIGGYDILINSLDENSKIKYEKLFTENKLSIYRNILLGRVKTSGSINELRDALDKIEIDPYCIISIKDSIREDVFDAIKLFNDNGIKIKILSGDSSKSVQEVASEIGWKVRDDELISGDELEKVTDENIFKTIMDKVIFARLKPEHKLRIIKTLKKQKIYTAMIGDGVNDLPAIKEADMGIAMEEGSSITKEVADIVLLKNKFSLLPQIFDEGNKIVNTVKSIGKLFITKNFFIIFITLMSLFFFLDFPLTPRRVSLINIFGIGLPAFIISLKNMNTGKTKNFMKDLISFVILSALIIVFSGYTGIYIVQKFHLVTEKDIQMVMLTIMVIINIANYFSIVLTKEETQENRLIYILYGFIIMLIYIFLSATRLDSLVLNIIKKFYELDYVRPDLWPVIMIVSIIGSVILFAAQKLRGKYISGLNNRI
ncbi:MAG: HAD-IC family P-type ATPase, partial [Bacteroidetes bacterium]|nr:HAD-IC family P-type ATPase [Bacteroidota bacterium]